MRNFMKISAALAVSAVLIGCATGPSPYQPIGSGNSTGFQDRQIESDRFRVSYTAHSPEEATDFALLRAAEIAKAEGYSHFQIINGGQTFQGNGGGFVPRVGLGVGTGGYRSRFGGSIGFGIPIGVGQDKIRQSFEVKLSRTPGTGPDFFSADEVIANLT